MVNVVGRKPKPVKPCWVCGSNNWYWREASVLGGSGEWLCGRCHPKPRLVNSDLVNGGRYDRTEENRIS